MIKKIFLLGFIFFFPFIAFAQQTQQKRQKTNVYLKFGTGLYWDINGVGSDYYSGSAVPAVNGPQIWIEGGIRLNDGLVVTAGIMYVTLKQKYEHASPYAGKEYQYSIQNYAFGLGYEFKLGKHSRLLPQIDFVINRTQSYTPYFGADYNNDGSVTIYPDIFNWDDTEAGAVFNLDYYYQFKNRLFLGVRGGVYYVLGMEGVTATPLVGFKF